MYTFDSIGDENDHTLFVAIDGKTVEYPNSKVLNLSFCIFANKT